MSDTQLSRRSMLGAGLMLGATAAGLSGCGRTAASAGGSEFSIVVAHEDQAEHYFHASYEKFKEYAEAHSGGRISVKIVPNALFGAAEAVTTAVQLNSVQMTAPTAGVLGQFDAAQNVWDTPFLFDDSEHSHRVLDGEFGRSLLKGLERIELVGLGYWDNGVRHLTTRGIDVQNPQNMRRVKIRVQPNALQLVAWGATGANPTPMAFGEVYTGLQQGTIDSQENPLSLIVSQRFYEVQDRVTLTGHVHSAAPLVISKIFFDGLPPELQKVVVDAGKASVVFNRRAAQEDEVKAAQVIEDAGVTIARISDQGRDSFRTAMQGAALPYLRRIVGGDTVQQLEAAIAKVKK